MACVTLGKVAAGENPRATRLLAREAARIEVAERAYTVDHLITQWAADHLASRKPGYAAEAERALRRALAGVLDRPAARMARGDALAPLQALAAAGKATTAARVLSYGRAAYGWATARELVPHNPFLRLPVAPAANARDRVPTLAETREIWAAADTLGEPFGPAVKLLVLTLCRRDEVGKMHWDELDADHGVWTLPGVRAKNGQPLAITLPDAAREVLADLARLEGSPFVFSTSGRAPVSGWSKAKPRLEHVRLKLGRILRV